MSTQNSIDLRSDTVTQPSPGMRAAIAAAPVGDDVIERDPTAERLQELAAQLLGKEAALMRLIAENPATAVPSPQPGVGTG